MSTMSRLGRYGGRLSQRPGPEAIYAVVRQVPAGNVASYGQIAASAGFPRHARYVGQALRRLSATDDTVPWHRIVNSQGRISPRGFDGSDDLQYRLLAAEGVEFDASGRIDLVRFGWKPPAPTD